MTQNQKFNRLLSYLAKLEKINRDKLFYRICVMRELAEVKPYFMFQAMSSEGGHIFYSAQGETIDAMLDDALGPRHRRGWKPKYKYWNRKKKRRNG